MRGEEQKQSRDAYLSLNSFLSLHREQEGEEDKEGETV